MDVIGRVIKPVATVLTVYGIETILIDASHHFVSVATVRTVYGIETL